MNGDNNDAKGLEHHSQCQFSLHRGGVCVCVCVCEQNRMNSNDFSFKFKHSHCTVQTQSNCVRKYSTYLCWSFDWFYFLHLLLFLPHSPVYARFWSLHFPLNFVFFVFKTCVLSRQKKSVFICLFISNFRIFICSTLQMLQRKWAKHETLCIFGSQHHSFTHSV